MPHIICAAIGNEQTEGLKRPLLVMKVESLSGHGGILSSGEKAGALTWGPGDCRTGLLQCSQRNWTYPLFLPQRRLCRRMWWLRGIENSVARSSFLTSFSGRESPGHRAVQRVREDIAKHLHLMSTIFDGNALRASSPNASDRTIALFFEKM